MNCLSLRNLFRLGAIVCALGIAQTCPAAPTPVLAAAQAIAAETVPAPAESASATPPGAAAEPAPTKAEEHEEGLTSYAMPLYYGIGGHPEVRDGHGKVIEHAAFGPFAVTNSMLVSWIVALVIILFARYATKHMKEIPDGAQNVWEFIVESLRNFLEGIIGRDLTKMTYWFYATVFIFILACNWMGLIPGVGTIGWGHPNAEGALETIDQPLFRGANADLNMTASMSMIFFVCWLVWAIRMNGVGGFFFHLFGPKGESTGLVKYLMIVVFFAVGFLEIISILVRPISLSFRLYGNIFAGENILEAMSHKVIALAWLLPVPFYFMELLVGFVQALVFMLLTAVFTLLIAPHDSHHDEAAHAH